MYIFSKNCLHREACSAVRRCLRRQEQSYVCSVSYTSTCVSLTDLLSPFGSPSLAAWYADGRFTEFSY